jgi:hypothetical protein
MMIDAVNREAELEEVTDALLLTSSDDFNALVAADLRGELGHARVYRVAPDPDAADLVAPPDEVGILGDRELTFADLGRRFADGARVVTDTAGASTSITPLFVVRPDGRLAVATDGRRPPVHPEDTVIGLSGAHPDRVIRAPGNAHRVLP